MIKNLISAVFGLFLFYSSGYADQQLDTLKHISASGAPFLTLRMLDQAQPGVDEDLYEWILWEQERYRILILWEQWNDLLVRIESLPKDLPAQFRQEAVTYQVRAYIELGQYATARNLIREYLWQLDAGASLQYRQWRQLVIETYLMEQRIEDARIAMLRYQQDFQQDDLEWLLLRARVLMQAKRYDEAIEVLSGKLQWKALAMKLLAEYLDGEHSAKDVWKLCKTRIDVLQDDPEQMATYWSIGIVAAKELSEVQRVLAMEYRLSIEVEAINELYQLTADQLWQAYLDYAQLVGNRSELLLGDDESWLQLAQKVMQPTPIKSRSLLAFLMINSRQQDVRSRAATAFMESLNLSLKQHQVLLDRLFNQSERFQNAELIPVEIRFHLVDQALKKADIDEATRLMTGLHEVPRDTRRFDWLLRQARVLILGGRFRLGNEVMDELITGYNETSKTDTDRILQVLFDLQTVGENKQAVSLFRRLLAKPIEPGQKREILFWMGDSFKAMQEYDRAALLYLQSAMYIGPDAMDPWAQTARFNAAESLQKAGLVDDARRTYQNLLRHTAEPARRSMLRHNIQQLWITQDTH